MSFLNEAAFFFFSTFKTSFSNFYLNYVKHLRKLKQINLPILPFLSRISTNQFNYPRNNRGIRKTQFPIEKLHNSGFFFDIDASEQHVYRPAEETGFRIRRGLALDLRCNALERDCIGGRRGEGNSRGSVSWRPFRHVTGRKERYLAIRQYGRPKWTRFTVGIGIQKPVLRMESWPRKRPRVHPLHHGARWCDSWRPDRRRVLWNDDDIKGTGWIFIDRSIFFAQVTFDDSPGLCFCIMHRSV